MKLYATFLLLRCKINTLFPSNPYTYIDMDIYVLIDKVPNNQKLVSDYGNLTKLLSIFMTYVLCILNS